MTIFQIIIVTCLFISKVFALQFGFTVRDSKNSLNGRFMAFGIIPDNTSSKVQAEILDQLTVYINEELHRRTLEGIDRTSFVVSDPVMLSALKDGRVLLGLKGEPSVFLNLFRMSCKYIIRTRNIWKDSIFFSDPIMILNFDEIDSYLKEFELVLINPAFAEEDESIYSDIFRKFTSSNASEDETKSLISQDEEKESSCCNKCIIF